MPAIRNLKFSCEKRSGRKMRVVISSALRFHSRKVAASLLEKRATLASVS
jgi:hypothetical protein